MPDAETNPMAPRPFERTSFVGFADLLGYRHIVLTPRFSEEERYTLLLSAFENFVACASACVHDPGLAQEVRLVQFSDCFQFRSQSPTAIISVMANFFASALGWLAGTYRQGDAWVPFLRGAVVSGWYVDVYDPTIRPVEWADAYRNAVGPAVANAYILSEETEIDGMRLVVSEAVATAFRDDIGSGRAVTHERDLAARLQLVPLRHIPPFGQAYEVPWFEGIADHGNTYAVMELLRAARSQFGGEAIRHYRGTLEGISHAPTVAADDRLMSTLRRLMLE